jgi:co-chaperonin GroES (HSP10)
VSGILVPKHIAAQRKAENAQVVPSVDSTASGPSALHADTTLTDEQVKLAIRRWDVDPVGQRIFVAPMPREKSSGGIILSQIDAAMSWDGVVIAAGPLAFIHRNRDRVPDGIRVIEMKLVEKQRMLVEAFATRVMDDENASVQDINDALRMTQELWVPSGPDEYAKAERRAAYWLQPGDKVTFARWSGEEMRRWWLDAPPLKVMNADDVIGMVKG